MEILYTVIVWAFKSLWPLPFLVVAIGLGVYLMTLPKQRAKRRNAIAFVTLVISVVTLSLSSFLGHLVTVPLMNAIGIETQGVVLSTYKTGDVYNEREVFAFNVLYQLANGQLIKSQVKTSDFTVYPITNTVRYPGDGMVFKLKYLPRIPRYFVIVSE